MKRKEIERQRPAQIVALREGGLDDQQQAAMLEDIIRQERRTGRVFPSPRTGEDARPERVRDTDCG